MIIFSKKNISYVQLSEILSSLNLCLKLNVKMHVISDVTFPRCRSFKFKPRMLYATSYLDIIGAVELFIFKLYESSSGQLDISGNRKRDSIRLAPPHPQLFFTRLIYSRPNVRLIGSPVCADIHAYIFENFNKYVAPYSTTRPAASSGPKFRSSWSFSLFLSLSLSSTSLQPMQYR